MVSRSRQRENENEAVWRVWECPRCYKRTALLQSYGKYEIPHCSTCNYYRPHFHHLEEQPGVIFKRLPPRIKREAQPIPLKKRKPRGSSRKPLLSDNKVPEYQMIAHYVEYFNQPLNYHFGNLWAIRHCEIEYEGQSDPL